MLYRIYTERKRVKAIKEIVSRQYDGFTLTGATGYWKNTREKSLIIEVVTEGNELPTIRAIAERIKSLNNQEAVLVQEIANNQIMV